MLNPAVCTPPLGPQGTFRTDWATPPTDPPSETPKNNGRQIIMMIKAISAERWLVLLWFKKLVLVLAAPSAVCRSGFSSTDSPETSKTANSLNGEDPVTRR